MSSIALSSMLDLSNKISIRKKVSQKRVQLVMFKLGKEEYAIDHNQFNVVVRTPNISVIPHTPDFVKGVSNIRGNIMAILDLELRFGIVSQVESDNNIGKYTLVIEDSDVKMGVIVKEVPLSITIAEDTIDYNSNNTYESVVENKSVKGVVKLEDRLVKLIDFDRAIN